MKRSSHPSLNKSVGHVEDMAANAALQLVRDALCSRVAQTHGVAGLKPSAVLVLLYPKDGEYTILLTKRTHKVEFNKGEICFPGGGMDPEDQDLAATALRETFEEMGIHPEDVAILGELDETATKADFVIRPFVGTIPYPCKFQPSPDEVAEVLEVPVSSLLNGQSIREELRVQSDGRLVRARSYAYGSHLIYGATARILGQLLEILVEAGWPEEDIKA